MGGKEVEEEEEEAGEEKQRYVQRNEEVENRVEMGGCEPGSRQAGVGENVIGIIKMMKEGWREKEDSWYGRRRRRRI